MCADVSVGGEEVWACAHVGCRGRGGMSEHTCWIWG